MFCRSLLDRARTDAYLDRIMCGICGKVMSEPEAPVNERLLLRMTVPLVHRGPDHVGTRAGPGYGLGHARLAILDLSEKANQPLANEDGSLWLVFNGAIYNFEELRDELTARGHAFRSRTDGEVLLHLYEELGVECLTRLRGMFAFAIYDEKRHTLFAARDRLGQKPLVYAHQENAFLFASDARALLKDPGLHPAPDPVALDEYLSLGYVPAPRTGFQGIRKLPPGHYLRFQNNRLEVQPYWRVSFQTAETMRRASCEELATRTRALLDEAVRLRLKSDVPVGLFLSGGIDSSAVAALMARHVSGPIKTFSIGFADQRFDESRYARCVADQLGAEHHEWIVEPDALSLLPEMAAHFSEPFADSSAVPCFYLARHAARTVKVVLGGDGGDECFAGYDRYGAAALAGLLDGLPRGLVRIVRGLALRCAAQAVGRSPGKAWRMQRFFRPLSAPPLERYLHWVGLCDPALKARIVTPEFADSAGKGAGAASLCRAYRSADAADRVEKWVQADLHTYLPGDLLVKVDRSCMAFGLEARSPFLDHELVEFAAALPMQLKRRGFTSKLLLKEAVRPLLPAAVIERPKQGFGVPIHDWLRGELREMAFDLLFSRRAVSRGLFRTAAVRELLEAHVEGRTNDHHPLWALLMLELWFRQFIDGDGA